MSKTAEELKAELAALAAQPGPQTADPETLAEWEQYQNRKGTRMIYDPQTLEQFIEHKATRAAYAKLLQVGV